MIINHDFGSADRVRGTNARQTTFDDIWPQQAGQTLMVGFDGPTNLFGFSERPHQAIYLSLSRFHALEKSSFCALGPKLVLTPLIAARIDTIEIAVALSLFGFKGHYRAVISRLPNREMVRKEVIKAVSGIDFDVVELGSCQVEHLDLSKKFSIGSL
ncbi:MAG: hypothetical protein GXP05_09855 [Alphaproteobacteria bacterium]|nr:hypothetical protein [Alphaproteobacteria bacterium]